MLMSPKEVAKKYEYCESHIRNQIRSGRIPAKRVGNCYVIDEDELPDMSRRRKPNKPKKDDENGAER